MSKPFAGKVIVLTGAASGLAKASACMLAAQGASLSLADVQQEALEQLAAELRSQHNADVLTAVVDVRNSDQVDKWINDAHSHFGRLDGAVNFAGVIPKGIGSLDLAHVEVDDFDFVVDVSLKGTFLCMRAQLRVIEDGGSIINAASVAALRGFKYNASYCAAKAGITGLTRATAKEFGHRGIRVNCIAPGPIETPMTDLSSERHRQAGSGASHAAMITSGIPMGRQGRPEEVAHLVAFLLGDGSTFISGDTHIIDGAMIA